MLQHSSVDVDDDALARYGEEIESGCCDAADDAGPFTHCRRCHGSLLFPRANRNHKGRKGHKFASNELLRVQSLLWETAVLSLHHKFA